MVRSEAIDFANFAGHAAMTIEETGTKFNPAIGWDDIAELRSRWPGQLIIKGPLVAAGRAVERCRRGRTACSCPTTADASSTGQCRRST